MAFRTIVVNEHSKLSYKNSHLIFRSATKKELIHLSEIDTLICETTDITITTMLIAKLIENNVLIITCDENRLPCTQFMPYYGRHDSSLQLKRQMNWRDEVTSKVWTSIISQKIKNQANFLDNREFVEKASSIFELLEALESLDPTNREGHSARIYFNTLYGTDFTREDDVAINAGLDYGYTLVMSIFAREIVKCGCLTQLGLKHSNQFNYFNLASDLMEPFRVIVDGIVYENRSESFPTIKRNLFDMFMRTYSYGGKEMFLTNIVSDYVKKVVQVLNEERTEIPRFEV